MQVSGHGRKATLSCIKVYVHNLLNIFIYFVNIQLKKQLFKIKVLFYSVKEFRYIHVDCSESLPHTYIVICHLIGQLAYVQRGEVIGCYKKHPISPHSECTAAASPSPVGLSSL